MLGPDDFNLTLISANLNVAGSGVTGTSSNFTTFYERFFKLMGKFKMAVFSASIWNTAKNISAAFGNNIISFSNDAGVTWDDFTIPDGFYTVSGLNTLFADHLRDIGFVMDDNTTPLFSITPFEPLEKIYLSFQHTGPIGAKSWDMRIRVPTNSTLNEVLGIVNNHVYGAESTPSDGALTVLADFEADFTNGVNSYLITCDLTNSNYGSSQVSNVLFPLKIDANPGYQVLYKANGDYLYQDVTLQNTTFNKINITITDNLGRVVDLGNKVNEITILFKKVG